jgi:hypothetical protein
LRVVVFKDQIEVHELEDEADKLQTVDDVDAYIGEIKQWTWDNKSSTESENKDITN